MSVTKITSKIGVSWTHNKGFWFWLIFNSMKWPYYQNNVKLSFTNITGLSMFKLCWMWILQWIKLSWHSWCMWDKLRWFSWFWQFLYMRGYLPLIQRKDYVTHMHVLAVYVKEGLPFRQVLSWESCGFLLMFSTDFTLFIVFLFFLLLITFFVCMHGF